MSELGDLLELIHGAGERWQTARLTLREWQHPGRIGEAIEQLEREQSAAGARQITFYGGTGEPEPEEIEQIVRVWVDGDRAREEREGPDAFPTLGIRDGSRWWLYSKESGASTNEGDPDTQSGVGEEALTLLVPGHLLGTLRLEHLGEVVVAGRPALLARGTARTRDRSEAFFHRLGFGADGYELAFDRERGVLLRTTGMFEGRPLTSTEVIEIAFDEAFPPETFRFELPEGESFQPLASNLEHVTLERAAELAPFSVLAPADVPADWRLDVLYFTGGDRPPVPPSVTLQYRSRDASQELSITQTAGDAPEHEEWLEWDDDGADDGGGVLVAGLAEPRGLEPGYAQVERQGTRATLSSTQLPRERLRSLARSLRPVQSGQV